jgi:WD40 repeat protein
MLVYHPKKGVKKFIILLIGITFLFLNPWQIGFVNNLAQNGDEPPEDFEDPVMPEYVGSIAWSPDGSKIAVGMGPEQCDLRNNDYSIRILDPQISTDPIVDKLEHGHYCPVVDIDWNSDGTKLVSSGNNGNTLVWDVALKKPIAVLHPPAGGTWRNAWKPNSDLVASISGYPDILIWNALTGEEIRTLHANVPYSLAWNVNGTQLASGGNGIQIWDSASWSGIKTITSIPVTEIAWSPDGNKIAGVVNNKDIRIWNVSNGQRIATLKGHTDVITELKWRADSETLASASIDGTLRIWNALFAQQLQSLSYPGRIYALDWNPSGSRLAYSGFENNTMRSRVEVTSLTIVLGLVAHAGYDQSLPAEESGFATVTLDGSLSQDTLGTITSYVWTKEGVQIAEGVTTQVSLPVGVHEITLTVTNNDNLTDSHRVTIYVGNPISVPTYTPTVP